MGVSDKHYIFTKSSSVWEQDAEGSLASIELKDTSPDVLDQPLSEEAPASQPVGLVVLIVDPLQFDVARLVAISGPAVQNDVDLGSPISTSPRERALLDDSSSPVCFVSSGVWQNDVAKLEDGWTTVKGKKSRNSIPPLDKNLRSYKGGSKSKSKS